MSSACTVSDFTGLGCIVGMQMNVRSALGLVVLAAGLLWFMFAPATSVVTSPGTQTVYWHNIVAGVIVLAVGVVLIMTSRTKGPSNLNL